MKEFTATEHKEKPILFEVLMDEHEDVSALDLIQSLRDFSENDQNVMAKTKKLRYMKRFEHDQLMYEEGRLAEIENTERENSLYVKMVS